jgi:hypothetical protein
VNCGRSWTLAALVLTSASLVATGCDVGQLPSTGTGEPVQVQGGQFVLGALPGSPDGGEGPVGDAGRAPLSIVLVSAASSQVLPGIGSKGFSGDVTDDAVAVGMQLADQGSGYWVVPVGVPDVTMAGTLTFSMSASFALSDPSGPQELRFVAIGPGGAAGAQQSVQVCIDSRVPDNGHACKPSVAPPGAVFALQWDTNFDLDLHVLSSAGLQFSPELPYGEALPMGNGNGPLPTDLPYIDRDSLRSCVPDGLREEDLVFPDGLQAGKYDIYVDPFAACGQNQVHYTLTIYVSSGTCPNCDLKPVYSQSGELLASQVTGGHAPPTFLYEQVAN